MASIFKYNGTIYAIQTTGTIAKRQGRYDISPTETAYKAVLGQQCPAAPLPNGLVYGALHDIAVMNGGGVLLQLVSKFLPVDIIDPIKCAGAEEDLKNLCGMVVFCSHINDHDNGSSSPGFVLEENRSETPANPFGFKREEISSLTKNVIPEGHSSQIIYLNGFHENGSPLSELEYVAPMLFFLGYLKTNNDLSESGQSRDSLGYNLKCFYAAMYAMDHLQALFNNNPREEINNFARKSWFPILKYLTRDYYNQLSEQEKKLLPPEIEKNYQLFTSEYFPSQ